MEFTLLALTGIEVSSSVLKVVFGGISALLDATVTVGRAQWSKAPHETQIIILTPGYIKSWAHRTHLSPLRSRGYFINAHGCSTASTGWAERLELTCCSGTNSTICCLHSAALNNTWRWQQLPLRLQWREHQDSALSLIPAVKLTGNCTEEYDWPGAQNGEDVSKNGGHKQMSAGANACGLSLGLS